MAFFPNTFGNMRRLTGLNIHGEPSFGPVKQVECSVVKLIMDARKTTVRADSSASRGNAEETVIVAKILFMPTAAPLIGDYFRIRNMPLRCILVHPRINVLGTLDHHECDFEHWDETDED